ncbi:MAG: hypothetical protein J6P60_05345, partial [Lachnospiraceae bacterium]|nr:hypothetical protein [Lachnospiraceae bacterium]
FWAFVFILLASNVGPAPSASYLVAGVMTMLCLFATRVSEIKERVSDRQTQIFVAGAKAAMLLFLISLILCKGFYVRVTEYPPSDIRMERVVLDRGPAKGIYVYPEEYDQMMETYDEMAEFTDSSDRVLYLGTQALSNLYTKGELSIPTTISTPAFNEQWIAYFEKYPDKMPTVIFLSKTTVDDQEKFFAMNPFGQWIAAHYDTAQRMDKEYVCVIFSKERMEMIHKTPKDDVTQFHEG